MMKRYYRIIRKSKIQKRRKLRRKNKANNSEENNPRLNNAQLVNKPHFRISVNHKIEAFKKINMLKNLIRQKETKNRKMKEKN